MKRPPIDPHSHVTSELPPPRVDTLGAGEERVIPIVEEEAVVGKRRLDSGGVRIHKRVDERQENIEALLRREDVTVERVPVNEYVDREPDVRQEGDTMIVPLCEEVLVKRLVLREEVRIHWNRREELARQSVNLRREYATVERIQSGAPAKSDDDESRKPGR